MLSKKSIAKKYLDHLQSGDLEQLLDLFSENATVDSPIYGVQIALDFFHDLLTDTQSSELELLGIFEEEGGNNLALYFTYKWTLKNGEIVSFEVVDIMEFDASQKISTLKIIYDTVTARSLVKQLKD
ncbi:MAG: SnoaL-like domain-containing protein [Eudoraea sp.]|nr:SnoaL-like domain-containing protein [Eudoraea sp.]